MIMEWYTNLCIETYFNAWLKAEEQVKKGNYFFWITVLFHIDRRMYFYDTDSELYLKIKNDLNTDLD